MLKNYIKIALKVLLRRKLFTCINLFGISFTIMVLVVVSAEVDSASGPVAPEVNLSRMLFIKELILDTKENQNHSDGISIYFFEKYIKTLKTIENASIYRRSMEKSAPLNGNKKFEIETKYTDENYWKVLQFDFVKGRFYTKAEVDKRSQVTVISQKAGMQIFGSKEPIGENIQIGDKNFRVIGVIKDVPEKRRHFAYAWVPYTTGKDDNDQGKASGHFEVVLLAHSKSQFEIIKNEFYSRLKKVEFPREIFARVLCPVRSNNEMLEGGRILGVYLYKNEGWADISLEKKEPPLNFDDTIMFFMAFFVIVPVLNLINLNTTRILERSSEIGIRKSFGASIHVLIGQFIIENLILTLLGGIIGIILACIAIFLLNESPYYDHNLMINCRVLFTGLTISIIIGLLSGAIPAYKMARLHPVNALRGDE